MMGQFLREGNGQLSMTRLLVSVVVILQTVTWMICCIKANELLPMPGENVGLTLGAMGMKVWQKGKER